MCDVGVASGCVEMIVRTIVDLSSPFWELVILNYDTGLLGISPVDELDADYSFLWRGDLRRDGGYAVVSILSRRIQDS